jgi:hypothetical protein
MLPFAAFDGKAWSGEWPAQLNYVELPISIDTVPKGWWGKAGKPGSMTPWADGAAQGPIELTRPSMVRIMCGLRLGVATTYKSAAPVPPPAVQPYPKDGLVISSGQPIERIEMLSPASPEWVPFAVLLLDPFDRAEYSAIRFFTDWKHPVKRADRRKVPLQLETVYRAPMDDPGWTAYHVEAVKRYAPGPDDEDCGLVTYVSGWVLSGPDGRRRFRLGAEVSYCDRASNTFMLPLGLINAAGRRYWVYQASGYEREGYVVMHPTPGHNDAQVAYAAGLCSR